MAAEKLTRRKAPRNDLTADYVREILAYNPETGVFRWKPRPEKPGRGGIFPRTGKIAGRINTGGHRQIMIGAHGYLAHRLAYLIMTSEWPSEEIDHMNGARDDNRWANLRSATHTQNVRNCKKYRQNSSGAKGVFFIAGAKRPTWHAAIRVNKKSIYLGRFFDFEKAKSAYAAAAIKYHGKFAKIE